MTRVALLLMMLGSLAAVPAFAQRQDRAELLGSGREAFEAGDYAKARADLWAYLEATASLTGASKLPQAEALYLIARMEPDAAVAAQHYETIVTDYAASTIADEALFRLGQYALVTGRPEAARERFSALKQNYPFSRHQGEIALWVGRTFLVEQRHSAATDAMIEGFARVRTMDLPYELTGVQRDALAAEYAYWLATAFQEEGDRQTAIQYWSLLTLDYPNSPQAAEGRAALAAAGRPEAAAVVARNEPQEEVAEKPAAEEGAAEEEPVEEAVAVAPVEEAPVAEAPVEEEAPAELPPPVGEPPVGEPPVGEPAGEEPAGEETPGPVFEPTPAAEGVYRPIEREEEPGEGVYRPVEREARPAAGEDVPKFPAPTPGSGRVYLQVGAFSSAARAADLSKRLRADGFPSSVEVAIVEGQGYYRVRVGPYRLPAESESMREAESRLQTLGYPVRQVQPGS